MPSKKVHKIFYLFANKFGSMIFSQPPPFGWKLLIQKSAGSLYAWQQAPDFFLIDLVLIFPIIIISHVFATFMLEFNDNAPHM